MDSGLLLSPTHTKDIFNYEVTKLTSGMNKNTSAGM